VISMFLASRCHRPSPANVRSTIHCGDTSKPFSPPGRLTISSAKGPTLFSASRLVQPPSAKTWRSHGQRFTMGRENLRRAVAMLDGYTVHDESDQKSAGDDGDAAQVNSSADPRTGNGMDLEREKPKRRSESCRGEYLGLNAM
ncbi:hypothetical protein, partial [Mesorhizobium sp.]|uniref:hypothetical protein n=1 Tax=Mesorhizobium sp. TaxID=1871066 RepID=UPI0025BAF7AA